MWAGKSKWDEDVEPMGEINVTPLVDVMLVLLIIFMVTAPLLTQGIDVDLPDSDAPPMQQDIEPLVLSIKKDGTLFMQNKELTLEQIAPRIKAIRENKPRLPVYIRGDAKTPYESVAKVMSVLAQANIKEVGLITEPEK